MSKQTEKVKSPKGEQARANLKRAAAVVLERQGYHQMRVVDVTTEAGVATGLFYHYFKDLRKLTIEVLDDFISLSENVEEIEKDIKKGDWYERIYVHNQLVVSSYAKRPGLMRCLFQMADEDLEFAQLLHNKFMDQLGWLVKLMPKMFPDVRFKKNQALMIVYTLSGGSERILKDYYINLSVGKESALANVDLSVDEITELLSVMFYRGLFLRNPPQEKLKYMTQIENMMKSVT